MLEHKNAIPFQPTHVLYTHDIFARQRHGGISRYIVELAGAMCAHADVTLFAGFHINRYVPSTAIGLRLPNMKGTGALRNAASGLLERVAERIYAPTIIHRSYYSGHGMPGRIPAVVTVYDMIHELFPSEYIGDNTSAMKLRACVSADRIIAISHTTKRDLLRLFNIPEERVSVVHLGTGIHRVKEHGVQKVERPYLLYVGNRSGYKGGVDLLLAYASSRVLRRNFKLYYFGGGDPSGDELIVARQNGIEDSVKYLRGNEGDLAALYRNATVLVYPSKYEGFGLPVLEAMVLGCPVLSGNCESVREFAGDAVGYVGNSLVRSVEEIAFDRKWQLDLKERGLATGSKYTWDRCASETYKIYRRAIEERT